MKTNNLIYKTTRSNSKITVDVSIRLNDECKNGHQDFAITGEVYEAGKRKTDKNMISAGCCHDDILKLFPEFQIFVNLHLSDYSGCPMYAIENGFYHLENGFNNEPINDPNFKIHFCEYYRVAPEQFDVLKESKNTIQYATKLISLGILDQWKLEADKAIEILEGLTGNEFLVDSVKSQFNAPKQEDIKKEEERINSGYYSEDAIKEREKQANFKKVSELEAEMNKKIKTEMDKFNIEKQIILLGFDPFTTIVYSHTKEVKFNWSDCGKKLSNDEIQTIKDSIILPDEYKYSI